MTVDMVPVEDLHLDPSNARTGHDIDQIAASIQEFGFADPIEAQRGTGRIIAGNGRYQAARQLKMEAVPVVWHDMDDLQATRYGLANNRLTDKSEWDMDILPTLLAEVGTHIPGFDDDFMASLDMGDTLAPAEDPGADIDRADELREKWQTETGQLWQVGRHRLLCGDSTSASDYDRLMGGEKADMVWTDPPYGISYQQKSSGKTIRNDGKEFSEMVKASLGVTEWPTVFLCGDAKKAVELLVAVCCLGEPKAVLVWAKPLQHRMHKFEPCHELIWYWGENGGPFYGRNVFEATREINTTHPTIKPVELVCYCISSQKHNSIYDPFIGSGTTMVAAEQLGRKCYGMEIDPKYCAVVLERMSAMVDNITLNQ